MEKAEAGLTNEVLEAQCDRYRMVLEGIKARLTLTEDPQDEWVKILHREIYALIMYALEKR